MQLPATSHAGQYWWLAVAGHRTVLHAVPADQVPAEQVEAWTKVLGQAHLLVTTTVCGAELACDYPGVHAAAGTVRCGGCCDALNLPGGIGIPGPTRRLRRRVHAYR